MKNIPDIIYLQVDPENEKPEDFKELGEVTWCQDRINDSDIEYKSTASINDLLDLIYKMMVKSEKRIDDKSLSREQFHDGKSIGLALAYKKIQKHFEAR